MALKTVKVTLIKSTIGASPAHKRIAEALGLRKIRQTVELPDTPQTRGALTKIKHLLSVEEF